MVRIGAAGAQKLQAVVEAKREYDEKLKVLESDYRVKRDMLRYGVTEAVRAAIREGVPNRQIALKGLGYADVGSLKQYLEPSNGSTASSREALTISAPRAGVTYTDDGENFMVTDSRGAMHKVPYFHEPDGSPSLTMTYALRKMDDEDKQSTQELISADFPSIVWED
jgi:hypothetical protein